jgi:hypothetical protein
MQGLCKTSVDTYFTQQFLALCPIPKFLGHLQLPSPQSVPQVCVCYSDRQPT